MLDQEGESLKAAVEGRVVDWQLVYMEAQRRQSDLLIKLNNMLVLATILLALGGILQVFGSLSTSPTESSSLSLVVLLIGIAFVVIVLLAVLVSQWFKFERIAKNDSIWFRKKMKFVRDEYEKIFNKIENRSKPLDTSMQERSLTK